MKRYYSFFIFCFIFIGGVIIRCSQGLARDYWYDEAFTGIVVREPWRVMQDMIERDVHPPLYYWLVKIFAYFFDYSPFGIRLFSLLFGMGIVASLYWIGKKMFSERAGLLAAGLFAVSPFAIQYSQESRMYTVLGFFILWAIWFFYKGILFQKKRDWLLWGICTGLAFYTHFITVFFVIGFCAAFFISQAVTRKSKLNTVLFRFRQQKWFFIGFIVVLLFICSWIPILMQQIHRGNFLWLKKASVIDIFSTLQVFFFGHTPGARGAVGPNVFVFLSHDWAIGGLSIVLFFLAFIYAYFKEIKKSEFTILTFLSFGIVFIVFICSRETNFQFFLARYFFPISVIMCLLIAGLATELSPSRYSWIIILSIYCLGIALLQPLQLKQGWSLLYQYQDKIFHSTDTIVTLNPFDYTVARFYFHNRTVRLYNKDNPSEDFSGWVSVGNRDRITDIQEISKLSHPIIIGERCEIEGLQTQELPMVDQLELRILK